MTRLSVSKKPYRQQGQGATEFAIIFVLFLAFLYGLVEATYLYRTKATLNVAAFEAARAGSLNNALVSPMELALYQGMIPLYVKGDRSAGGLAQAMIRARFIGGKIDLAGSPVEIVSPSKDVFDKFKVRQKIKLVGHNREAWHWVIPNDSLTWRPRTTKRVRVKGQQGQINVQDANLLKIKVLWCHELVVPALDAVVQSIWPTSREKLACQAVGAGTSREYVPVVADALVRMQSPIYYQGRNLR